MNSEIKTANNARETYKDLLIRRDAVKKERTLIWFSYIREFGDMVEALFKLKIECIALKKKIAFCQAKQNRNEKIYSAEMEHAVEYELAEYYEKLEHIQSAKNSIDEPISSYESLRIKKIYRKIATMIHPDLHAELFREKEIQELWNRAKIAYLSNDYKELKEIEFLIIETIENLTNLVVEYDIENLDEKIAALREEIYEITTTDPYKLKFILESDELILEEKARIEQETEQYRQYSDELNDYLSEFTIIEVIN